MVVLEKRFKILTSKTNTKAIYLLEIRPFISVDGIKLPSTIVERTAQLRYLLADKRLLKLEVCNHFSFFPFPHSISDISIMFRDV